MITSLRELRFYLKEDGKRNGFEKGYSFYLFCLFCRMENAFAYRYLRILRHREYHSSKKSFFHKFAYYYYTFRQSRLGGKYHIHIPINKTGYGLRIMHLSGGGGDIAECQ